MIKKISLLLAALLLLSALSVGFVGCFANEESDAETTVNTSNEEEKKDDKVDNEEEEDEEKVEELKKEEKKDVENKCKNSKETSTFDKINAIYNSVRALKPKSTYTSRQEKLDNAVEYFKN